MVQSINLETKKAVEVSFSCYNNISYVDILSDWISLCDDPGQINLRLWQASYFLKKRYSGNLDKTKLKANHQRLKALSQQRLYALITADR